MMKAITIEELYDACAQQLRKGRGKRKILLSGDDEGNSYHELFYGFTAGIDFSLPYMSCCLPVGLDAEEANKEYVVLG